MESGVRNKKHSTCLRTQQQMDTRGYQSMFLQYFALTKFFSLCAHFNSIGHNFSMEKVVKREKANVHWAPSRVKRGVVNKWFTLLVYERRVAK